MPRIVSYLNEDLIKSIRELYHGSSQSLSTTIAELVDIGYRVKQHHKAQKSASEEAERTGVADKHTEYLLRIMAMVADSYRCVRNNKSKHKENNTEDVLAKITANAQNYIDGN